ncbi:hypothetical protein DFQ30_002109 [Apophysomyces sp. BC1015]|nr:hypothetical protein DFQ30_002109 [Apophysomyces sp. BC1015]
MKAPGRAGDILFGGLARLAAIVTLLMLGGIIFSLIVSSLPTIEKFGFSFLWRADWDPPSDQFGALVPIYGTIATSVIALIIAVPKPLQTVLGAMPLVGALVAGPPVGIGMLAAGVILAIMTIPYISAVMRDVFEVTPVLLKESAYGIGCTTWEVMWKIVLPFTRTGVIGGIMLGLGRALGETMAVTFVIGNTNLLSGASLFAPGNSITSALANEFAEAQPGLHTAALMELGLILFVITFVVLALSKIMLLRLEKGEGRR